MTATEPSATATETMFGDLGHWFPGCHRYARLRPNVSGTCLRPTTTGNYGFDLFDELRYPALELLEVEIEGTVAPADEWRIEGHRWLVPASGVSWPVQNWAADPGEPRTWSVLVRYNFKAN